MSGYDFCRVHGFGRIKGTPWYENGLLLTIVSLIVGFLIASYYFSIGPSLENQKHMLSRQDKSAAKQDETLKMLHSMETSAKEKEPEFTKEFQLGYRLFGVAKNEFYPFQGPPGQGILVHWERNQHKYELTGRQ